MRSNLVAGGVEILHLAVIGPLMGHVEGGRDGTAVRILSALLEQIGVQTLVQVIHGIVEGQKYDLRYLLRQVVTCRFGIAIRDHSTGVGEAWVGGEWKGGQLGEGKERERDAEEGNGKRTLVREIVVEVCVSVACRICWFHFH